MNRAQKMSWICVVCMSLTIMAAFPVLLIHFLVGTPKALYAAVIPWLGLPLSGLICLFIPKDKGKVTRDERDLMIRKNAAHAGFIGAFLFTCFACMIPFFVLGPDGGDIRQMAAPDMDRHLCGAVLFLFADNHCRLRQG